MSGQPSTSSDTSPSPHPPFSHLLVALDGSPFAERVLPYAAELAERSGARLTLLRATGLVPSIDVVPPALWATSGAAGSLVANLEEEARTAVAYLSTAAGRLRDRGLEVQTRVVPEAAAEAILEFAQEDVDLIALTTHGRSGLGRALFGSVADEVVRRATVPLLLVPGACSVPWPDSGPIRVLVALDGSRASASILEPGVRLAEAFGGEALLFQVVNDAPLKAKMYAPRGVKSLLDAEVAGARAYLAGVAETMATSGAMVTIETRVGAPAGTIVATARDEDIGLIALATRGHGGVKRLVLGSVATELVERAVTPLLLLRPESVPAETPPEEQHTTPRSPASTERSVRDIMVRPAVVAREDMTLSEVAHTMLDERIGCLPILDAEERLVGIVTESDFTGREQCIPFSAFRVPQVFSQWIGPHGLEQIHATARNTPVKDIMTRSVQTTTEDELLVALVGRMIARGLKRFPVLRDNRVVGIVSRHDLLRLMDAEGNVGSASRLAH